MTIDKVRAKLRSLLIDAGLVLCSLLVGFLILEAILSVWSPWRATVTADKITLPYNQQTVFRNDRIQGADPVIYYTTNELGFRGPPWPSAPEKAVKILFVGGSTTQAIYASDGKEWTTLVLKKLQEAHKSIWINNAGFDGHSTFGHLRLLQEHIINLHVDFVAFLIGINDVGNDVGNPFDSSLDPRSIPWYRIPDVWLRLHTRLGTALTQAIMAWRAQTHNVGHGTINLSAEPMMSAEDLAALDETAILARHADTWLPGFEQRVRHLIEICRQNAIEPILITQPLLFGPVIDPASGGDLGRIKIGDQAGTVSGALKWRILEQYNDVTRKLAKEHKVFLIDLAHTMEKTTKYFYDLMHYNNAGNQRVAEIIADALGQSPQLAQAVIRVEAGARSDGNQR